MTTLRMTNWLLVGILLIVAADFAVRLGIPAAVAETFKLDTCITPLPDDKPSSYLHVVTHPLP